MDALELLKRDHQTVKNLFEQVNEAKDNKQLKTLFDRIDMELNIQAYIEETVFYPEMQKIDELKDMVQEALEEHQEVKTLIEEIEGLDPEDEEFSASLEELLETSNTMWRKKKTKCFRKSVNYAIGRPWIASAISSKRRKASNTVRPSDSFPATDACNFTTRW